MSLTSCIISPYYIDECGYARKTYKRKSYRHHRLVYAQHNNIDINSMKGLVVMHLCDNRSCINPDHLRLGTNQDNVDDRVSKGRCGRASGINNASSKLTDADVIAIRASSLSQGRLAKQYGVHQTTVSDIKRGKLWKHLL